MTEELEYLGMQPQWLDYHRAMAVHACSVLSKLLEGWTEPANGSVPPHLLPRLLNATRAILQGVPFERLTVLDFSLEEAIVLREVVMLAAALDDIELSEEVASLLPTVFELCQTHLPDEFCKELSDDTDMDGPLVRARSEILAEEEVVHDPTFIYRQYTEAEEESLQDALVTSLGLCLREVRGVPTRDDRIEYLQEIVASSPMDMVLWQEVTDTLIFLSPSSFSDFLPLLLEKCIDDECGGLGILGIADYSFRKQLDPADGPLPALVKGLKTMNGSDRRSLLRRASDFLDQAPELFPDLTATEDGFRMLCKMLGVRGLMTGRQG